MAAIVPRKERGIRVMRKEGNLGAKSPRISFNSHALYVGYKCDQRPFYTRIVVGKYEQVAILENDKELFVACRQ